MAMILALLALLIGGSIMIWRLKKKNNRLPPMCPSSLWSNTIRSGFCSLTHKVEMCEWVADHTKQSIETGAVFRMAMPLPIYFITCCDHRLGRILLAGSTDGKIKEAEKSSTISALNLFPGVFNILTYPTASADRAKTRRCLSPAFSTLNLQKTALRVVQEESGLLVKRLQSASGSGLVDMKAECIAVVFDILCKSLLDAPGREEGGRGGVMDGFDSKAFVDAQNKSLKEAVRMANNPLRKLMFWSADRIKALKCRDGLNKLGATMLQNYRAAVASVDGKAMDEDLGIMAALIRHDYPSEEHRISDLVIFLIAGHETTAMSLSFFLLCMAKNPEACKKLQDELDKALRPGEVASLASVGSLEYFSWCYKEVQRLYPVAPVVGRQICDGDVNYNDMILPKGSVVAVNLYAMGRQRWINRPLDFLPERWSSSNQQASSLRDLLMPFSIGKRSCIGQNLAVMEMKVLAATLLRNFEFHVTKEVELELFITLKPKDLVMQVIPR